MTVITADTLTLKRIQALFGEHDLPARIVEVAPAAPELGLEQDAYLEVDYPNGQSVVIWPDTCVDHQLRMRVVVLTRQQIREIDEADLLDWTAERNQQNECYGTVCARNPLGVTVEYRLPYQSGVLDQTILSAAEGLAKGAALAQELKDFLLD